MEHNPVLALMKFGASAHMEELFHDGCLYMQPLREFRKLEDAVRGDLHEALAKCWQADGARLQVRRGDEWLPVGGIVGQMLVREAAAEGANAYCMFAMRGSHAEAFAQGLAPQPIDVERLAFGDSVVIFTDGDEFVHRVRSACEEAGLSFSRGLVEYVDRETYHGDMGPLRKFSAFDYQSEFRFVVEPELHPVRIITLGSLQDIAYMCPVAELNERLRLNHA